MANYTKVSSLCLLPSHKKYSLSALPLNKKYRSHLEIIALVIEAVKDECTSRFSIMKHANINCTQLKKYLQSLIEIGFVETDTREGLVAYRASEEGLGFLRQYYVLLGMLFNASVENRTTRVFGKPNMIFQQGNAL